MDITLSILAIILMLVGISGAIIPVIPGPIISFLALFSLYFTNPPPFTDKFITIWAVLAIVVTAFDQVIPIAGTKKMGGTKYGVNGSIIGLLVGIFFFPPIGIILGPFLGALAGELIGGKDFNQATKAGFGSFLGFLSGVFLKLVFSFIAAYYTIINLSFS
ncbi:MAG: DUF456 domain-containing protein [Bacteroidales bacterium]|nr:DUF456 domain-containing protein [Bacteroidales bacterium]